MSLTGTYDDQNIFAKIIAGDAPAIKIFEDDIAVAFMDIFPQSPGHCLVVPKEPARNLLDLSDDMAAAAIQRVKALAKAVETALEPDGIGRAESPGRQDQSRPRLTSDMRAPHHRPRTEHAECCRCSCREHHAGRGQLDAA